MSGPVITTLDIPDDKATPRRYLLSRTRESALGRFLSLTRQDTQASYDCTQAEGRWYCPCPWARYHPLALCKHVQALARNAALIDALFVPKGTPDMTTTAVAERPTAEVLAAPPRDVMAGPAPALAALASPGTPGCPRLTEALAQACDRCKVAIKASYNDYHKFAYASADEVIATAGEALAGSGLALIPTRAKLIVVSCGTKAAYALHRWFVLSHSSGEFVPVELEGWPVIEDRGRPLDKAFCTALTGSLAYQLRDLLRMPRAAEDDVAAQDDRATPQRGAPAPAKPAPAKPTAATATAKPAARKLPADGQELHDRLTAHEAKLAREGLCKAGELVEHIRSLGEASGLPRDMASWTAEAVPGAVQEAKLWEAARRKHKAGEAA